MKVLSVLMDNRIGGPQMRALLVGQLLKAQGVDTCFLAASRPGEFARTARASEFHVTQLPLLLPQRGLGPAALRRSVVWLLALPRAARQCARVVDQDDIDVVHVNGLLSLAPAVGARLAGRPLVWHLITTTLYPHWIVRLLMPIVRRLATHIVFVCEASRDYYLPGRRHHSCPWSIIWEPADLCRFDPARVDGEAVAGIRRELGLAADCVLIGATGHVNYQKAYEYLIEATVPLQQRGAHVAIAGDIPEAQRQYFAGLQRRAQELGVSGAIHFLGRRTDIPEFVSALDVFVMSSVYEGTPIALMEAMALARPIVATAVGGIPELIEHGRTGFLVPPRDPEALATAVLRYLNDPALARRTGEEARRRAVSRHTPAACATAHLRVYEQVCSGDRTNADHS